MERGRAYPSYRRLPSSGNTSAGTPPPEPVKILARRPVAPAGSDRTTVAAASAGTKSDDDNNGGSSSSNANYYYAGKTCAGGGKVEAPEAGGAAAVREQDRFMPIANVIRIMRRVLPTHAKIADDAKETIQECVSEYISFITSEANERCQQEQRKTITAEDLLWAMSKLGFDDYVEPLGLYLQRYRETEGDHRGSLRGDPLLTPLKRAASDSGHYGVPPPQYHAGAHDLQSGHHAIATAQYFYAAQHGHPHLAAPLFFPGGPGGSGGSAANGGAGGMVPGFYYREAGSTSQGGSSQRHPGAGFDPFAPYK